MPMSLPVSQIMTRSVRTVTPAEKLSEVRRLFADRRFHHLPVVEDGELLGILSSRDLIDIYRSATDSSASCADELLDQTATIPATMQTDLVTMREDESIERAIDLLAPGDVHSVLVLDARGRLAGIVTNVDVLDYLFADE